LPGKSSIGRGDLSEEIAAGARRLVRENEFSPPRFLSALDKDWYADVELCELPAGQRGAGPGAAGHAAEPHMQTIINRQRSDPAAVIFLRTATIIGLLSRSVTNA